MSVSDNDVKLMLRAFDFAAGKHRDQRRKGGEASPYINHLIDVACMLWDLGGVRDPVTIAAAILHDTVEDTATTSEEIEREFGAETASVVMEVTDDKTLPNEQRKRLQVDHASGLTQKAATIKIADKVSNIKDILTSPPSGWSMERKMAYVDWGVEVVDRIRGTNPSLERYFDEIVRSARAVFDNEKRQ